MADSYIEEFLYRGRPEGDSRKPAWHLIIGTPAKNAAGQDVIIHTEPLTAAQAKEAGFDLPAIIKAINLDLALTAEQAVKDHETLKEKHADILDQHKTKEQYHHETRGKLQEHILEFDKIQKVALERLSMITGETAKDLLRDIKTEAFGETAVLRDKRTH